MHQGMLSSVHEGMHWSMPQGRHQGMPWGMDASGEEEMREAMDRHGGGYGLKKEVEILILKYKERGCLEDVLKKIRLDVFGIDEL